ncbi:DUF2325 domain-containing protein [Siccirubricoccus phaeus]|uniref:DUF2325 domain-containing protein n=1 Tax=Siccirubricoccus phaeus TaxID=2595053 RepID=UPI0011F3C74E|nr:DUF2325 domain-containing protein [Siccirubricoccus phaeus]
MSMRRLYPDPAPRPAIFEGLPAPGSTGPGCCAIRFPPVRPAAAALFAAAAEPQSPPRRRRIWDLGATLHCSIIGTCLSTDELRRLLRKLGLPAGDMTDHELHKIGVELAAQQGQASRLLNKALEERHRSAIRRFGAAAGRDSVRRLWREALESGDIPGAYWALLTHPATDQPLVAEAFGDVHMLSHLVGAANRADIRRLAAQDREIATLRETVARQQARLRHDLTERDGRIRGLQALLVAQAGREAAPSPAVMSEDPAAEWREALRREASRRDTAERRRAAAEEALARRSAECQALAAEAEALRRELAAAEAALAPAPAPPSGPVPAMVLYVGGRSGQTAALRAAAERAGVSQLIHHDAEAGAAQLPGLIGRADLVVFPVDCVSHDAALNVKRLCRQLGRAFRPLRSTGAASLLAALRAGHGGGR